MKNVILLLILLLSLPAFCQKWKPVFEPFDSLMLIAENYRNNDSISQILPDLAKRMDKIASQRNDDRLRWRTLYWSSVAQLGKERTDSAMLDITMALNLVDSVKYGYDYQRLKWQQIVCSGFPNQIARLQEAQKALQYYKEQDDTLMMALMCLNIGDAYLNMKIPGKALSYLNESFGYYRAIGFYKAIKRHERVLLSFYAELGDTITAKRIYNEAVEDGLRSYDTLYLIIAYTNAYCSSIDQEACIKAYDLAKEIDNNNAKRFTTTNMGWYYFDKSDYTKAIDFFNKANRLEVGSTVNRNNTTLSILEGLAEGYRNLGNSDSAYHYLREYYALRDSLDAINNNEDFEELYEKLALEREEEHIVQEQSKARNKLVITILIFSLLLLAAISVIYYFISRRKLKDVENKELAAMVEAEKLKRQLYQEQTENRERELTTNSLLLIEKKKMIDSLSHQIEQHGEQGKIEAHAQRELQNFISIHQGTEESFKQFYDYFSQVHPDFFLLLKEKYPSLTKGDLRLCAYIRIGMDNKQIAQVLSVHSDTVKKARYRLRQKFGLDTKDSLSDFLLLQNERRPE